MKLHTYKYILISYLFVLKLESSDQEVQKHDTETSKEVKKNISKHFDPLLSLQASKAEATKGPKKVVKTEQVDQKVIKVTYSDGTTKIIG